MTSSKIEAQAESRKFSSISSEEMEEINNETFKNFPTPKFGYIAEYILVSDRDSKVLKSSENYQEIKNLATLIRSGDGEVTIFRSLKA